MTQQKLRKSEQVTSSSLEAGVKGIVKRHTKPSSYIVTSSIRVEIHITKST